MSHTTDNPVRTAPENAVSPAALVRSRTFWLLVLMLSVSTFFHYGSGLGWGALSPWPLARHTVERIIFLVPVIGAAFAFGQTGGLVTLAVAILLMLPRVFWVSSQPVDAFLETLGIGVVGYIVVWMIETQDREKRLRQQAVEELQAINSVSRTLCQSLDLDTMLRQALARVLQVVGNLEPRGAIFLLDPWRQTLHLRVHQGLSREMVERDTEVPVGECLCGITAESGDVLLVQDALNDPRHTRCLERVPHSHVCVPLRSRDRLLGVMDLYLGDPRPLGVIDSALFATIGGQIGAAIENARLCENLRFYVRQITRAQEDERQRIARELHDDTAQRLIDLARRLDSLTTADEGVRVPMRARLEELQHQIDDMLQDLRRFSRDLRPTVLDDLGLLPALEGLVSDLQDAGIETKLFTLGETRRLPPEAELALFRIVQEALNNVRRHSGASRVEIVVGFAPDRIGVSVHDDGHGFSLAGRTTDLVGMGKFGLVGMEERAQLLGGIFAVRSKPGHGTTVLADLPV